MNLYLNSWIAGPVPAEFPQRATDVVPSAHCKAADHLNSVRVARKAKSPLRRARQKGAWLLVVPKRRWGCYRPCTARFGRGALEPLLADYLRFWRANHATVSTMPSATLCVGA
jgi:hypothetical protein